MTATPLPLGLPQPWLDQPHAIMVRAGSTFVKGAKAIYDAIRALSGGEWFHVPESETWTNEERERCVTAVRKWLDAHKEEIEGVIVYETVDLKIVVADRRLPAPRKPEVRR